MTAGRRRVTLSDGSARTVEEGEANTRGAIIGTVQPPDRDGRQLVEVVVDGWRFEATVEDADRAELRDRASKDRAGSSTTDGPLEIRAIIPGRVLEVRVAVGDLVEAGQALLVVEAMKMQNELRTPQAGTVAVIGVGVGSTVEIGDVLVVLR